MAPRLVPALLVLTGLLAALVHLAPTFVPWLSPGNAQPSPSVPLPNKAEKRRQKALEFFSGPVVELKIGIDPENWESLKRDQRRYVEATVTAGDKTHRHVALKLKGGAGSFQGLDRKPGMTLSFDQLKGAERFHGLTKLHLNNGAQDGTYLNELIAGEIARKAGVPAGRCTHALVEMNGRDLGLYVVREAFTKDFLAEFYKSAEGDLYEGGFVKEIEEKMEKDQGDLADRGKLKELIAVCQEADNAKRWQRLNEILDVDQFISYRALEAILCHWDGYNLNRNNYRLYLDPATGKFSFFLHGMDQTFGGANTSIQGGSGSMVGSALMRCPEASRLYPTRVERLYREVLKPIDWGARVIEAGSKVREALEKKNPQAAKDYQGRIQEARHRVENRIAGIGKLLGDMPKPFEFDSAGVAKLDKGWQTQGSAGQIDEVQMEGKLCLHIRAAGDTTASWRRAITLEPGKYRFEAKLRTAGVVATPGGSGEGAGLRISGGSRHGQNGLAGDQAWQIVSFPFDAAAGSVVLVAELRASKGEVWFERDSLRLVRGTGVLPVGGR